MKQKTFHPGYVQASLMRSGHFIEQEIERRIRTRRLSLVKNFWKNAGQFNRAWRNDKGESFLHIALSCLQHDIFNWLYERLENDEVILSLDNEERSLIWYATKRRDLDLVMRLLTNQLASDRFADHTMRDEWMRPDKHGVSILHLAAQDASSELLEFFIPFLEVRKKTPTILGETFSTLVDHADEKGKTALHWACEANSCDNIVILINLGADMYALDNDNFNFLMWFEKNNPPIFGRLDKDKQLQLLSYLRTRSREDGESKALYEKLATDKTEEELDQYEQTYVKTRNHVVDDDKRALQRLIKKADAHLVDLKARPKGPFNAMLYRVLAQVCIILAYVSPFLWLALAPLCVILLVVFNPFAVITTAILGGMAFALGILGAGGLPFLFLHLDHLCLNKKPPPVPIAPDEFSAFIKELDTALLEKCRELKDAQGRDALPISSNFYEELKIHYAILKSASTVDRVIDSMDDIKIDLEKFLVKMLKHKKPFSFVPGQTPADMQSLISTLVDSIIARTTEKSDPKPEAAPTVSTHWATLHARTASMEAVDVDDLEMANSAFGKRI